VGLEQGFAAAAERVRGAHEADENMFVESGLRIVLRFSVPFHESTIVVITTIVKRNVAGAILRLSPLFSVSAVLKLCRFCPGMH
jgi:hypothetical protein